MVRFCNLVFNFTEISGNTLNIDVHDDLTEVNIGKFSLKRKGALSISLDQLEKYSDQYEIDNMGYNTFPIYPLTQSYSVTQPLINENIGDVGIFHYELTDNTTGTVCKYHASCLDFVSQSIAISVSYGSFGYIEKIKGGICGAIKEKQSIALKSWSIKKIKNLIKSNIYNFVNHLWEKQNFRSLDCVNRYISINANFARETPWVSFHFSPGFCSLYCNDLLDSGLYNRIFSENAFVRCLGSMSFKNGKFSLRCPQKLVYIEDLFKGSLFLQSLYHNFPLNAGHIGNEFIDFLFREKYKSKMFDCIDFKDKTKYYKVAWMCIYMDSGLNKNEIKRLRSSFIEKFSCPKLLKRFLKEQYEKANARIFKEEGRVKKIRKNKSVLNWLKINNIKNSITYGIIKAK